MKSLEHWAMCGEVGGERLILAKPQAVFFIFNH
jgi:hypothetical protein